MPVVDEEARTGVSTLELFFDLVFVFVVTQLTSVLAHEPSWTGLIQVMLMLGVIYWMYSGYAWLTNVVRFEDVTRRLILLSAMAALLVVGLAVPGAFSGSGATFGLAYVMIVVIHLVMFARSERISIAQATIGLAPFNLSTAAMVLAGGIAGGDAQYVLWAAAFTVEWVSPLIVDPKGFEIRPAHFVERHGLVVIVAIGESVVSVGIGAGGLPVNASLVASAVLGLALSACLWWSYFGGDESAPERALAAAPVVERPLLGVKAFGYYHLLILLGVVSAAAALKHATGYPFDVVDGSFALALGGGAALFLAGEALYRRVLRMAAVGPRAIAGLAALATAPLGSHVAASAQIAALVAILVVMLLRAED